MSQNDYPTEVTESNFPQLVERAKRIKKKAQILLYSTVVLYGLIGLVAMSFIFFHLGVLLLGILPEMPSETFFIVLFVVFIIVFEAFLFLLLNLLELILKKAIKPPRHEERIFAECILIVNYLQSSERMKAAREVNDFVMYLSVFAKDIFNRKGEFYGPEISQIASGKSQVKRMLFFSDTAISELLTSFGLALIHGEDSKAYSTAKQIIEEARKYGELEGRLQRLLSRVEDYPTIITLIITIVTLILTILHLIPYG